ncbi:AtpZ/AtpI family protein [Acetohalobium arabaticum]|uniref:F0F1-ATPase subunit n=1 Tax=Acetohalobium arabaticum (strain ATCC 49924 / DSM 5501 / Z-7288) TaxID=574087 RepID=D9QTZ0_ACEAZ|nr:AtpZ/AtpI family protein [Acetohalobium arabaticum]ADL13711.1 conserved hypothetical protein [Acetohalobium arabaticum DSM 5501]
MKENFKILQALALLSQIGIVIIIPVFFGVWCGNKLDKWFGTGWVFLILGVILGVLSGMWTSYKLIISQQSSD